MPRTPEETMRRPLDPLPAKDTDAVAGLWAAGGAAAAGALSGLPDSLHPETVR